MKAVVMAGGLGARLAPLTKILPKPLLPIGERSVLEIQLEHLLKYGIREVIFTVFYKADLLQAYFGDGSRWGVKVKYNIEEQPLGTCGPLALLKNELESDFLVMNGDILTTLNFDALRAFHEKKKARLTVVSKRLSAPYSYGTVVASGDRLVKVIEKPNISVDIVAGIYLISPELLSYIPENQRMGMDEFILKLLAEDVEVHVYPMEDYWLDIGSMDDYRRAQEEYREHFAS